MRAKIAAMAVVAVCTASVAAEPKELLVATIVENSRNELLSRTRHLAKLDACKEMAKRSRITGRTGFVSVGKRMVRTVASKDVKESDLAYIDGLYKEFAEKASHIPVALPGIELGTSPPGWRGILMHDDDVIISGRILQVVSDSEALVDVGDLTLWVSGFNTSNFVDDERVSLLLAFELVGSRRYTTALGTSNQVWEVKVDPTAGTDVLQEAQARWLKENEREWTSAGKTCNACLIGFKGTDALLLRVPELQLVGIPIASLSAEDQELLAEDHAAHTQAYAEAYADYMRKPKVWDGTRWK